MDRHPTSWARIRKLPLTWLLAVWTLTLLGVLPVSAQNHPIRSQEIKTSVDSGPVFNSGPSHEIGWSTVVGSSDASWIRLTFSIADLAHDPRTGESSLLRIESLEDGAVQFLDATSILQWKHTSAYFNGNGVEITLLTVPNGRENRIAIENIIAGLPDNGASPNTSICGPTDDRMPSNDDRGGRGVPIGCSVWLIDDAAHCFLTAGHCMSGGSLDVVEFNVPFSDSNGNIQHPGPEDQYAVDTVSEQFTNGGIGNDWGVFGCFANSTTGLTPFEAQGVNYVLSSTPPPVIGQTINITGYGTMPTPPEWNQVQKSHSGPYVSFAGTTLQYATDTTGGNSGSPVFNEATGEAIGIHTHAGCNSTGGANNGTAIDHPNLQNALANPLGICSQRLVFSYPNGLPATLIPDQAFTLQVDITEQGALLQPGTAELLVDTGSGFVSVTMTSLTASLHEADIPAASCGTVVRFYVQAQSTTSDTFSDPSQAPSTFRSTIAAPAIRPVILLDDFETDLGWTVVNENLLDGPWERGDPIGGGDRGDPASDFDGSGQCFLTDNVDGNSDVDEGPTRLISPVFSLALGEDGIISYARWFSDSVGNDFMTIEISNNGGSTWSLVEQVSNDPQWVENTFVVSSVLPPTSNMQLRFSVDDSPNDSVNEAGVDAVRIELIDCDPAPDMADLAVTGIQVDYDPVAPGINPGPGGLGQPINVIVTVQNNGNTFITAATVRADASVSSGSQVTTSLVVTDFDPAPGTQSLAPANTADITLSFTNGSLDRCGTYTLLCSHDGPNLQSMGNGGGVMGDGMNNNDDLIDRPDELMAPDDAFSPDLLELAFGTFQTAVLAQSEVIEDIETEKVKVSLDYNGLGAGGDSHNIELIVDITDDGGAVLYPEVFRRAKTGVASSGSRSLVMRFNLSELVPTPTSGVPHRIRMRLFDTDSQEVCIESLTSNTFMVQ